jgi:DNA-binding transcriptional LysR family regulator
MNSIHEGRLPENNGRVPRTGAPASPEQLAGVDLNLIVAFDVLARERSVTRAAQGMGVTQSAMSHALRRLRDLFADPLLVRGRGGMTLTPRAASLVVPLRSGLVTIGRALTQPNRFEARSARRAFCISSPDLFDVLAIPPLLARIRHEAPGVDIAVVPVNERRLPEQLETGEVDVAVMARIEESRAEGPIVSAPGILRRTLFYDRFSCFIRRGHPALKAKGGRRGATAPSTISLEAYAGLSHALVSPTGGGPGLVDHLLEDHGLVRRIVLRVPHFYSALAIVAKSDLILTAPAALARLVPDGLAVVTLPPPLRLPRHSVNLIWHERFSKEPGHGWLRGMVAQVASESARVPATGSGHAREGHRARR